ncbi:MAG: ABC transporter permease [Planctomycetes bacterium]|nr:ABC transporter permease [Planctomycetota bacterium]
MTLRRLVARHVLARPARAALLAGLAGLTVFLLVFLRTIVTGLTAGAEAASPDRLMVQSGIGPMAELPVAYLEPLRQVPGVGSVARWSWFGGRLAGDDAFFACMAVDLDVALAQYPEFTLPDEQRAAALADRRGIVVGRELARRHGWKVGDTVPVEGTMFPLDDGRAWELTVRGVYASTDPSLPEVVVFMHWAHLEETRRGLVLGAATAGTVSLFSVRVAPGADPAAVAAAVDARWAAGPVRTHTQTERMHRTEEVGMLTSMIGWLSFIGGVVVLAMLVMVANAMGITVAERRREAGILLALGFPDHVVARLVVVEAASVVGTGGLLGTTLAVAIAPLVRRALTFGGYHVRVETVALAVAASVAVGIVGGLVPALRLGRVRPVEVFREEA